MQEFRSKFQSFSLMRYKVAIFILILILVVVVARLFFLATFDHAFLLNKSQQQANHPRIIPASRGVIFDRNDVPLAISAPIDSIVFDGKILAKTPPDWQKLAQNHALGLSYQNIENLLNTNPGSQYIIAKKNLPPDVADSVDEMNIPGVYVQRNQQSFYPEGSALAELVGFTDSGDNGQSGLELAYNHFLTPTYGKQSVTESNIGQTYSINHLIKEARDGQSLTLSVDSRLQYVAYQAIMNQVQSTGAEWGGVVIMNPHTGEVLTAVSYPSYNPNATAFRAGANVKDRVITDLVEPGSTIKPLTISTALESGQYTPTTPIDTNPGFYMIGSNKVKDDDNFGLINVTGVITKSSNVGVSKIGLSLPKPLVYNAFLNAGFSKKPSGGKFPGEAQGYLYPMNILGSFQFATMMFGYSVSVSLLQMARFYSMIANNGILLPVSYIKLTTPPQGQQVLTPTVAKQMIKILQTVMNPALGGTGLLASVPGYAVAAKTGTAQVLSPTGYLTTRHNAFFVGIIPANAPRLVIAVALINPTGYYQGFGGVGAGPVFSKVAMAAMHILGITPSNTQVDLKLFQNQQKMYKQLVEA